MEKVFKDSDKTYGYRAMQRALYNEGIEISEYKVRRIMRENGFYPETRTKYKPTHNGKRMENIIKIYCNKILKPRRKIKYGLEILHILKHRLARCI